MLCVPPSFSDFEGSISFNWLGQYEKNNTKSYLENEIQLVELQDHILSTLRDREHLHARKVPRSSDLIHVQYMP